MLKLSVSNLISISLDYFKTRRLVMKTKPLNYGSHYEALIHFFMHNKNQCTNRRYENI